MKGKRNKVVDAFPRTSLSSKIANKRYLKKSLYAFPGWPFYVNTVSLPQQDQEIIRKLQREYASDPKLKEQLTTPRAPCVLKNRMLLFGKRLYVCLIALSVSNYYLTTVRFHVGDISWKRKPEKYRAPSTIGRPPK